jgi:hypothetical protein
VTVPLLLAGLGIGALASQLGAVTVSAVPAEPGLDQRPLQRRVGEEGDPAVAAPGSDAGGRPGSSQGVRSPWRAATPLAGRHGHTRPRPTGDVPLPVISVRAGPAPRRG